MASSSTFGRHLLSESSGISSRNPRRLMSASSDTSPPPSDDASSTNSDTMAVSIPTSFLPQSADGLTKDAQEHADSVEHVERVEEGMKQQEPSDNLPAHTTAESKSAAKETNERPARRKFAPEPLETSTRSSKKEVKADEDSSRTGRPKKKFAPEPVETSTRSSKVKEEESNTNDSGKPKRRFAPDPVETSTRSSKDSSTKAEDKPRRKFAPEPVETSTRTSKKSQEGADSSSNRPRRKFAPEPIETTTIRRRNSSDNVRSDSLSMPESNAPSRSSSGGRRFTPELLETAKGSFRKSAVASAVPKHLRPGSPKMPLEEEKDQSWEAPEVPESRFSAAALSRRARSETRQHSYCVPHLPIIESDSSDEETDTPMTDTPTTPDIEHRRLSKVTESKEQSYTDFVFQMAEQMDEKLLRDRAMAAYINEYEHEPVMHFAAEEDEDDEVSTGKFSGDNGASPSLFRRQSHEDLNLAMEDMRRHHQQLEQAKREFQEDTAGASRFSAAALATRHHLGVSHPQTKKPKAERGEDMELAKMRAAASPPMLGDDIVFPVTVSPKMTRCDVDQAPRPRRADSGSDEEVEVVNNQQLWSANASKSDQANLGLWGGLCKKNSNESTRPTTPLRSGLQTPAFERGNPFESHTPRGARTPGRRNGPIGWNGVGMLPHTPPRSNDGDAFTNSIDRKLQLEKQIEEEFPNRVITQIYNYLSLGYPSLARPFDEELSKISRISIEELRRGDRDADGQVRGYIGSPEGEGVYEEDDNGAIRGCRRWEALKSYVREWARQSPGFASERYMPGGGIGRPNNMEGWGANAPVRKGSWGL